MRIKGIVDEDFCNYKEPSMFIIFPSCTFKCEKESNCKLCQNSNLINEPTIEIEERALAERYKSNLITKAIVLGGLEPFDSIFELQGFINCMRRQYQIKDKIIIYTGYTEEEILNGKIKENNGKNQPLIELIIFNILHEKNLIIKYGRFIPNQKSHLDPILGIKLASDNQYAKEYNCK